MNKLICWLLGHKCKYNFVSLPDKCICSRCKTKWYFKIERNTYEDFYKWVETEKFTFTPGCERTDEELIKQWVN